METVLVGAGDGLMGDNNDGATVSSDAFLFKPISVSMIMYAGDTCLLLLKGFILRLFLVKFSFEYSLLFLPIFLHLERFRFRFLRQLSLFGQLCFQLCDLFL